MTDLRCSFRVRAGRVIRRFANWVDPDTIILRPFHETHLDYRGEWDAAAPLPGAPSVMPHQRGRRS